MRIVCIGKTISRGIRIGWREDSMCCVVEFKAYGKLGHSHTGVAEHPRTRYAL